MTPRLTPGTVRTYWRMGEVTVTPAKLMKLLAGFEIEDDPAKVRLSWQFQLDGVECAVWEYMGSMHLNEFHLWTAGSLDVLVKFLTEGEAPHSMPAVFRSNRR